MHPGTWLARLLDVPGRLKTCYITVLATACRRYHVPDKTNVGPFGTGASGAMSYLASSAEPNLRSVGWLSTRALIEPSFSWCASQTKQRAFYKDGHQDELFMPMRNTPAASLWWVCAVQLSCYGPLLVSLAGHKQRIRSWKSGCHASF